MQPKQIKGFQYRAYDPYAEQAFMQQEAMRRLQEQKRSQPAPKQQGKGGFLSSIISELSGAGGAAGGAAIGTALLPGVGTLIGAGLGGFLGGTGGRVAENKVRDNRIGLGDALKEGALSGALSAVGTGASAIKGARAASKGLGAVDDAGRIAKVGNSLRAGVANPKVAASPFGASQEASLVKTLNSLGLKGSAKNQYQKLPQVMSRLGGEIDTKLAANTNTSTLSKLVGEVKSNTKALPQFINGDAAYNKSLATELRDLTSKFGKNKITASEVQAAKTELSSKMGGIFNKVAKGADLNPKEASRLAIWKGLDTHVASIAPEVKALTAKQAKLYEAAPGLLAGSKKTFGVPILGIKSQTAERAIQGGQDLTGRALQGIGGATGKAGGSALVQQAKFQAPGNLLGASGLDTQPMEQPQGSSEDEQLMQIYEQMSGGQSPDMGGMGQDPMGQMQPQQPTYTLQQAMADIAKYPKDQAKIMNYYQFVQEAQQGPQSKPLNSTAAGNVTDLQNGIVNLQQLGDQFQSSGSNVPIIGGLLAKNPFNTEAQSLQANVARTKQVIGKALEGGVLRKEDEIKYAKILPTLNDSDAVAQQKIAYIMDDLTRKLELYQQNLGGGGGGYEPYPQQSQYTQQGAY